MNDYPKSRRKDIVIQELTDEVLIYDVKDNKAKCLNETSSLIWQLCDGKTSVSKISQKASNILKQSVTEELVLLALDLLKKENLLVENYKPTLPFNGLTRRQVIRKVGITSAVALPIISSLVAPTSAMAQSGGLPLLSVCTTTPECASGLLCLFDSVGTTFDRHCCLNGTNGGQPGPGQCVADANICTNNNSQLCCNRQGGSFIDPSCPSPFPIRCTCA